MKIGVLTFHNIPNIGAILQAYSLCLAFRYEGAECDLIDYTCKNIENRELKPPHTGNLLKDFIIKYLIWPRSKKKIRACQLFMKKQNMYSKNQYTKLTLNSANDDYDAFVSGSDMIWNLSVTDYDWTYFCDFVLANKKKFSYGSSIGDNWKDDDFRRVKELLSRYRLIGVRESDTCDLLNSVGLNARLVCDPTMLLTRSEWEKISVKPKEINYVLVYFPSEFNLRSAKVYAIKHKLQVVVLNWALPIKGVINVSPCSPQEWIGYFLYANAVFSGSFHGLLFSLYFEKPVWTDNYGNRITSILNKFDIDSCLLSRDPDMNNVIDFQKVSENISKLRMNSLSYIQQIINDCKQ